MRWTRISCALMVGMWALSVLAQQPPGDGLGYRVGAGDVLEVDAFQHEDISGEFPV